jgi:hypothetical protein
LKEMNTLNWGSVYPYCFIGVRLIDEPNSLRQVKSTSSPNNNGKNVDAFITDLTDLAVTTTDGSNCDIVDTTSSMASGHLLSSMSRKKKFIGETSREGDKSSLEQGPVFVLGSTLFKTYYTEFDLLKRQVTFAPPIKGNRFSYTNNNDHGVVPGTGSVSSIVNNYATLFNKVQLFFMIFAFAFIFLVVLQYLLDLAWKFKHYLVNKCSKKEKIRYLTDFVQIFLAHLFSNLPSHIHIYF